MEDFEKSDEIKERPGLKKYEASSELLDSSHKGTKRASEPRTSGMTPLGQMFSPSSLGCLLALVILAMLVYFAGKDLPHILTGDQTSGGVSSSPSVTVTPVLPRSRILLGSSISGTIYYFQNPAGVYPNATPVAWLSDFEAFHWSPSRSKIAFIVHDPKDELPILYVFNLNSGEFIQATKRDGDGFPPQFGLKAELPLAWSQDEQYVAFVAYDDKSGKSALFVSEVVTGKVRKLTDGTNPVTSVAWETDKNRNMDRIVYVLVRDNVEFFYSVEKNGANNGLWLPPAP
ncbi:MAG: hypothetical protein JW850_12410 [Thermoflexales bacterium]|nr:hypothetical protein [Thermoflexales bacterium]